MILDRVVIAAVTQTEGVGEDVTVVDVNGSVCSCPSDGDIGGSGVQGVGAEGRHVGIALGAVAPSMA